MKRAHIIIEGKVQGVSLRYYAKHKAQKLRLKGYIKNIPNGNVEIIAEGSEKALKELVEFCKNSPGFSRVTDIKVSFEVAQNTFDGFAVEY